MQIQHLKGMGVLFWEVPDIRLSDIYKLVIYIRHLSPQIVHCIACMCNSVQ